MKYANMLDFIKKHWLGFSGISIGLISIIISLIIYNSSKKERIPILYVDPNRTEIISSDRVSDAPIIISKAKDGSRIESDLTALRFYFWNKGKESIKNENVLQSLGLYLDDEAAEIIDYKILKRSRDITGLMLSADKTPSTNSIIIGFDILEHRDGMTGQIIYLGDPGSSLEIAGIIEGVRDIAIYNSPSDSFLSFWDRLTYSLGSSVRITIILVVFFISLLILDILKKLILKRKKGIIVIKSVAYWKDTIKSGIQLVLVIIIIVALISFLKPVENAFFEFIPPGILP